MKPTVILTDKTNEFLPFWVIVDMSKKKLILVLTLITLFWVFIYKRHIFQYKSSLFIGSFTNILLVLFYYFVMINIDTSIYADKTTNSWILMNQPGVEDKQEQGASDLVTDLGEFKQNINIKKKGIITNPDFAKNHGLKSLSLAELYATKCEEPRGIGRDTGKTKSGWLCVDANDKQQKRVATLINEKDTSLSQQGYDILSIIFTVSILIYNIDKPLFKRLIVPLFKFVIVPSVALVYIERFIYNESLVLDVVLNDYMFIFLTVSVVMAIIIDIINVFKKK